MNGDTDDEHKEENIECHYNHRKAVKNHTYHNANKRRKTPVHFVFHLNKEKNSN